MIEVNKSEEQMVWFETFLRQIKPVEIDKFTDQSVWVKGRRRARFGSWSYYPTWAEAHAALLREAEANVDAARRSLEYQAGLLGNIKGMKQP